MSSWAAFAAEQPEFAAEVLASLRVQKHMTLATVRADGSPRISGTEIQLDGDDVTIGSMPRALKAHDLQRDPRFALHAPTVDPPPGDHNAWVGEAKIAGLAIETSAPDAEAHAFRLDLHEVVHTRVRADQLEIRSWHPGRGLEVRQRD
ncbi:MAG: pyridoxamine 5-phosphate oxidase-related FMN-binding [Frankiales bacterium]|nr:pyridoxamine 5-phosphate oxidase-related FMN-binding [Frankiales bacterium]